MEVSTRFDKDTDGRHRPHPSESWTIGGSKLSQGCKAGEEGWLDPDRVQPDLPVLVRGIAPSDKQIESGHERAVLHLDSSYLVFDRRVFRQPTTFSLFLDEPQSEDGTVRHLYENRIVNRYPLPGPMTPAIGRTSEWNDNSEFS